MLNCYLNCLPLRDTLCSALLITPNWSAPVRAGCCFTLWQVKSLSLSLTLTVFLTQFVCIIWLWIHMFQTDFLSGVDVLYVCSMCRTGRLCSTLPPRSQTRSAFLLHSFPQRQSEPVQEPHHRMCYNTHNLTPSILSLSHPSPPLPFPLLDSPPLHHLASLCPLSFLLLSCGLSLFLPSHVILSPSSCPPSDLQ